jgi:heat shock protein 4
VLGIDVGNSTSVVALARNRGIDVVLNSESKRETPSMVNFALKQVSAASPLLGSSRPHRPWSACAARRRQKQSPPAHVPSRCPQRFIGVSAGEKVSMEPKNTIGNLKRFLGKRNGDAEVAADAPTFSFTLEDGPEGVPVVKVQYQGAPCTFRAEQLLAALLAELRSIGEKDQGAKITDCVLSVPGFFTEQQRRAVLDAASITGLNVLRLIHETTATALAYGIYKTDWTEKPQYVAFVDAGHASLQVRGCAGERADARDASGTGRRRAGGALAASVA